MSEPTSSETRPRAAYQVVARRFRPATFADVVGQEPVLSTLRGCLSQGRLPHAFLFCGSRGVGKTTTARILARAVNCEKGPTPDPCGTCAACRAMLEGRAGDVIELDAASNNSVDEVRALREQAAFAPLHLRRKVYILDEVHMFSRSAFNALLKILEEPPPHVLFILATTEPHKVPETVRSRCQVLPFRRITESDIVSRLRTICEKEGVEASADVLGEIAAGAMGGLRDAETELERILPLARELDLDAYRRLTGRLGVQRGAEVLLACLRGDARAALGYAAEATQTGVDERECLGELLGVLRQVFLLVVDGADTVLVEAGGEWRQRLLDLAAAADVTRIDAMLQVLILARERIRQVDDRRLLLELTLVRLARLGELSSLDELLAAAGPAAAPATAGRVANAPAGSQPVAAPLVATGPVAAPGDRWQALLSLVRGERPEVAKLLERGELRWLHDKHVAIMLPQLKALDRRLLDHQLTWLLSALRTVCGQGVEVECQVAELAVVPEPATDAQPAAKAAPKQGGGRRSAAAAELEKQVVDKLRATLFDAQPPAEAEGG
jgi:DNA polymerase-3 subunit gamma/tau